MPNEVGASEHAAPNVDEAGASAHTESQRTALEPADPESPDSDTESFAGTRKRESRISKGTTSIDVEIFGSVYHVRGEQDPEYLQRLAEVVDGKMREISRHVPVVDSGKIAILAALNLADELLQCNNQQQGERVDMMEKVEELTGLLTEALDT